MQKKEEAKIKKSRKRLKLALALLGFLLVLSTLGFLLRTYRSGDLTLFQSEKILKPIVGQSPEQEMTEEFQKAGIEILSLSIIGEKEFEILINGGTKIILKSEEVAKEVSSLQPILARFKIEGRRPKKIDLRFEKPVVVF